MAMMNHKLPILDAESFGPTRDAFPTYELPAGTQWQTEGFSGAVLRYQRLCQESDPGAYLQALWNGILEDGKRHLVAHSS